MSVQATGNMRSTPRMLSTPRSRAVRSGSTAAAARRNSRRSIAPQDSVSGEVAESLEDDAALAGNDRPEHVHRVADDLSSYGRCEIVRLIRRRDSHPLLIPKSPSKISTVGRP